MIYKAAARGSEAAACTVAQAAGLLSPQGVPSRELPRLMQVLQLLTDHPAVGKQLKAPSVSYGTTNLYMRGPLEADTRPNLSKVALLTGLMVAKTPACPGGGVAPDLEQR